MLQKPEINASLMGFSSSNFDWSSFLPYLLDFYLYKINGSVSNQMGDSVIDKCRANTRGSLKELESNFRNLNFNSASP